MTEIKDVISKDTWLVIKDNYERGSYTTAITNLIQYLNEVVQDKANLENVDNTSLIEQAFFTKPPKLAINNWQTKTEKDIQEGVGHLLKGICLAIRNPRSHKRYNDDKTTANTIIMFCDYILNFIRESQQPTLIEDWLDFVFDENFVETEKYSNEVLSLIPNKKKYDLLVSIFRERNRISGRKLNCIVKCLINSITTDQYNEFIEGINKELIKSKNDAELKAFFTLFPPEKWNEIIPLAKLRIENIIKESIININVYYENDGYGNYLPDLSDNELIAVYAFDFIEYFDTKAEILEAITFRYGKDKDLDELYFEKYFSKYLPTAIEFEDTKNDELPF